MKQDCNWFVSYVSCVLGPEKYVPAYAYATDYDHDPYPRNISAIVKALLTGWTFGKYFSDVVETTALYP